VRVFLCDFGDFLLGVPTRFVASLTLLKDAGADDNLYSLGDFFGLNGKPNRHGIILKPQMQNVPQIAFGDGAGGDEVPLAGVDYSRDVLLVPSVERVEDIEDGEFKALPELLASKMPYFSGIAFKETMIVLADPGALAAFIKGTNYDTNPDN